MRVEALTRKAYQVISPHVEVGSVEDSVPKNSFLVVMENGNFLGLLTAPDVAGDPQRPVTDCLCEKPRVDCDREIESVLELMRESRNSVLPVFAGDDFIGVVTQSDIADFLDEYRKDLERGAVGLKQAEHTRADSQLGFASVFNDSPVSLWEEDFSAVKGYIDGLRRCGVKDFRAYFESHPESVVDCAGMVKILDVNKATLGLYKAKDKKTLQRSLNAVFSEESYDAFREELVAIAEGKTLFECEATMQTLTGQKIYAVIRWSVAPGHEKMLSRVFVSVVDITEYKRTENALRDSEERYRRLVENLRQEYFFYSHGPDGVFRYLSPSIKDVLGYSQEEFMTHYTECLTDDPVNDEVVRRTELSIQGKKQPPYEVEIFHKDGSIHRLEVSEVPVFAKEGKVVAVEGLAHDITERKKAQEALRESEERYRALFQGTAEGIAAAEIETKKFKYVNPALCRMLGYSEEELKQMGVPDIHPKEHLEHVISEFEAQARGDKTLAPNIPCLRKDGKIIYADINTAKVFIDGRECNVGFFTDITQRKKAEEELQRAHNELEARVEQRTADLARVNEELRNEIRQRRWAEEELAAARDDWENIFKSISDAVLILDRNHRILDINPAGMAGLQRPKSEIIGRDCHELFHSKERSPEGCPYERLLVSQRPETGEMEVEVAHGFYLVTVAPILDNEGKLVRIIHIAKDITQRKKAEKKLLVYQEQLRSLASELSLAEERLRRRIATDVHDHIGQNLAISKIKLESLRESASSPEFVKALGEVRNLIAQAIESTRSLTFELSPPVLYELGFEAAVEWLLRRTRQRHGLSTEFKSDRRSKPLSHNIRVLLFQAVRELLVNVAKHAQARHVTVSTRRVRDEIRVSVEDDGIGFEASRSSSADYKTSGFGLFSIRERLGHIGGHLKLKSEPGRGTKVTLVAPIDGQTEKSKERRK